MNKIVAGILGLGLLTLAALWMSGGLSDRAFLAGPGKSVVYIRIGNGGGTGFVIEAATGHTFLVTNNHICEKSESITVQINDWSPYQTVSVIKSYPGLDLCIAQAPADVPALHLGQSPKIDQEVVVVGHPKLRPLEVARGHVKNRFDLPVNIGYQEDCTGGRINKGWFGLSECIMEFNSYIIDNHIEPGNSGSPLMDVHGNVIGVIFAGSSILGGVVPYEALSWLISRY